MIFRDDSHETSCLICYFLKEQQNLNCRLLIINTIQTSFASVINMYVFLLVKKSSIYTFRSIILFDHKWYDGIVFGTDIAGGAQTE